MQFRIRGLGPYFLKLSKLLSTQKIVFETLKGYVGKSQLSSHKMTVSVFSIFLITMPLNRYCQEVQDKVTNNWLSSTLANLLTSIIRKGATK